MGLGAQGRAVPAERTHGVETRSGAAATTRSEHLAIGVGPATGTVRCSRMSPVSIPSSMKWAVRPISVSPLMMRPVEHVPAPIERELAGVKVHKPERSGLRGAAGWMIWSKATLRYRSEPSPAIQERLWTVHSLRAQRLDSPRICCFLQRASLGVRTKYYSGHAVRTLMKRARDCRPSTFRHQKEPRSAVPGVNRSRSILTPIGWHARSRTFDLPHSAAPPVRFPCRAS